ncbi:acetolactate decarboxylase [Azotosporobacter soli]|uniref:acetolactate decarboxylase n=1 Tax=Azotosporobacter soli TaxID=3055040 RepID=UPI0031FE4631
MKKILWLVSLVLLFSFGGLASAKEIDTAAIYQGSTIEALLAGNYSGVASVKQIKQKGDTGLGTFAGLDGEMIILDGQVYKAAKNGTVTLEGDAAQSPFYAVTQLRKNGNEVKLAEATDYAALKLQIDNLRSRSDLPYAVVVKGTFAALTVRSVGPYEKPYPLLSNAVKEQSVFQYKNVQGTLVGFWLPSYLGNANASGYHLHFLSDDKQKGGHVLELQMREGRLLLDEKSKLEIEFAPYQTVPLLQKDSYKS